MEQEKPKAQANTDTKPPSIPPWKYKSKPDYSELTSDPESAKSTSPKKWTFITIVLLIISNATTAGYFMNKYQKSNPKTGQASQSATPSSENKKQTQGSGIPGIPDYLGSLARANDAKRKADLTSIGTAINQYYVESDLPEDFPTEKRCIGTSPGCYDLVSLLVPDYLREMPMDPKIGSKTNTGYLIYYDGQPGFVLEASGENEPVITIYR